MVTALDPNNYDTTQFFRTWVTVANPSSYTQFTLYLAADDGAVVYVNGLEVGRVDVANGTTNVWTSAGTNQVEPVQVRWP